MVLRHAHIYPGWPAIPYTSLATRQFYSNNCNWLHQTGTPASNILIDVICSILTMRAFRWLLVWSERKQPLFCCEPEEPEELAAPVTVNMRQIKQHRYSKFGQLQMTVFVFPSWKPILHWWFYSTDCLSNSFPHLSDSHHAIFSGWFSHSVFLMKVIVLSISLIYKWSVYYGWGALPKHRLSFLAHVMNMKDMVPFQRVVL